MFLLCAGTARNHGSHALPESGQTNHHDVNQQEEQEKRGAEKVNRARGLLAAEHRLGGWKRRDEGGRHSQAGPDHQGEQHEDYTKVGKTLEHVIRPGFRVTGPTEAQMVRELSRERSQSQIGGGRK